jgi:magnesium transporter
MTPVSDRAESQAVAEALSRRFLLDYPAEAARRIERMPAPESVMLLGGQPPHVLIRVWELLASDVAAAVIEGLPPALAAELVSEATPTASVAALAQLEQPARERLLAQLRPEISRELQELLVYPEDTAGRLMDPRIAPLRSGMSVAQALERLRTVSSRGLRELFIVDDAVRLLGRVEIQDLAVASPERPLADLVQPLIAFAEDLEPREDFVDRLQQSPITELPVVNLHGRFVGVIRQSGLIAAVEQETSVDVQTMVGASRDERALSSPALAVRRRLPWLQINLLTAFLAAAVVGMFEGTIAKFTALAVLLPVVAGQSGNAGAQALAVTMRALALREITVRHWARVLGKEAVAGLANGVAVAVTTGLGVYLWSRSWGLVVVCMLAMVISMLIAGLAGALVPVLLKRLGQDPALASSIILTTVTDVVGFLSFLGIATLLAGMLEAG